MRERVSKESTDKPDAGHEGAWPKDLRPGESVLVSACLLGEKTRYDGRHKEDVLLLEKLQIARVKIIPVCPEVLGGLSTPRPAAELRGGNGDDVWAGTEVVVTVDEKNDVTQSFVDGAKAALAIAKDCGARYAFLQERSPSCGVLLTHSGGDVIGGPGVAAAALRQNGLQLISVSEKL